MISRPRTRLLVRYLPTALPKPFAPVLDTGATIVTGVIIVAAVTLDRLRRREE